MKVETKIVPTAIVVLMAFLLVSQLQQVANASSKSPYESGRDHGCDDADISDVSDRYINQPEKGPNFHTNEFMRGYNDGYDECSGGGNNIGEAGNDPCNYHGINVCDSSGQCDNERFDCYSDDCVNGEGGTTGQCEDDDEPYNNNDNDNDSSELDNDSNDNGDDCQSNDDFCDNSEGCESESVDCIDDRGFDEDDYNG
jgi:hypothetical protein